MVFFDFFEKSIFYRPRIPDSEDSAGLQRPDVVPGLNLKRMFDLTKTFEFTAVFNFLIKGCY